MNFIETNLLNMTIINWLILLSIFLWLLVFFKIIHKVFIEKAKRISPKNKTRDDNSLMILIKEIKWPFYFLLSIYLVSFLIALPKIISQIIFFVFIITLAVQGALVAGKVVDYIILKKFLNKEGPDKKKDKEKETIVKFVGRLIKGGLWTFSALLVLSNLGININSLIAGLGIGGLAFALAAKDIIKDIFSSVSIMVDKPFVVGDFIALDKKNKGRVQKIGIKTTRLKTLEGHTLIVANKKLTEATIKNIKRAGKKRINFVLGVVYETPWEKLKKIPEIVSKAVNKNEKAQVKRVIFKKYGASSLDFEITILVKANDMEEFLALRSQINYAIFQAFKTAKIDFAYPTQVVYLQN